MLDLHILLALQDGWKEIAASQSKFTEYLGPYVPASLASEWYSALVPGGDLNHVKFTTAFAPDLARLPTVAIQGQEEPAEEIPFAFGEHLVFDTNDGNKQKKIHYFFLRETVTISMYVGNPELLRGLHSIIRGILVKSFTWLLSMQYDSFEYQGSNDFLPQKDLMPEELGVYTREQRWVALSRVEVLGDELTGKSILISHKDAEVTVNSNTGGVDITS